MPKNARRRKKKPPEASPHLVEFFMRHRGMSKAQATSAAARGRRMLRDGTGGLTIQSCGVCGEEPAVYDPADPAQRQAGRDAMDAHLLVCQGPAA